MILGTAAPTGRTEFFADCFCCSIALFDYFITLFDYICIFKSSEEHQNAPSAVWCSGFLLFLNSSFFLFLLFSTDSRKPKHFQISIPVSDGSAGFSGKCITLRGGKSSLWAWNQSIPRDLSHPALFMGCKWNHKHLYSCDPVCAWLELLGP